MPTAKFQDLMKETSFHFLFLRVFINLAVQNLTSY